MRPFNLEAVKAGRPIAVAGTNYPAHFVAHIPEAEWHSCVVIRVGGSVYVCDEQGRIEGEGGIDFCMLPAKRTVWVNLYREDDGRIVASHETHDSEDEATHDRLSSDYIGAFPIEIKE
ncbi:hypothetical protein 23F_00073 [Ralstonia phage Gerry]|uniref:Uncharacterized protein n=1 Tax=Ralstonia phage Gerry TaxID=2759727 RepID=A0A7G5BAB0_9CAUD|nr:hypothetical protein KMC47_gp50 [Ralstonia phage Gerry]QMV33233.1 hypothetical protein 23F_00073 [Ralstonia phage Gerry]